jgi:hypothetical protein
MLRRERKTLRLTAQRRPSKFLAIWLGFLRAILLIIIIDCCSVGRAGRIGRHKALHICVRMFGKNGASAKNYIWSATLTQRYKQKQFVGKLECPLS